MADCRTVRRRRIVRGLAAAGLVCLFAWTGLGGCRRVASQDAETPASLLVHLCNLHRQHAYKEMESMVEPARVGILVNTLMAVDQLLQAGAQLQQTAEQRLGPRAAVVCDISDVADYLGPFSRNMAVVSTRIEGDRAIVVYQAGSRVPVERAEVRRTAGRWIYVPDEPDEGLPALLLLLTDRMVRLRGEAESGTYEEGAFIEEYGRQVIAPLQAHLQEAARQRQEKAKAAATQAS